MKFSENPEVSFLKKKLPDLEKSKEVTRANKIKEKFQLDEQLENSPIQEYLDRIDRILKTERPEGRTGADLLIQKIKAEFVLDIENEELVSKLANDLYESEKRQAINQGRGGDIENLDEEEAIERYKNSIIEKYEIQQETLDNWLSYLKDSDDYPMWFKYYTLRGLSDMGRFYRDEARYAERTKDTIAPFPERNSESLGFVRRSLEMQMEFDTFGVPEEVEKDILENTVLDEETEKRILEKSKPEFVEEARKGALKNLRNKKRGEFIRQNKIKRAEGFLAPYILEKDEEKQKELVDEFLKRLETGDFAKLYAFAQVETAGSMNRESIVGEWVKYPQGGDYKQLEQSLYGKGTGWCTAEGSAKCHVEQGDFYVYYTKNKQGLNTEPRIAIRTINGEIAEIRGVNPQQELEPQLVDIAKEKYKDLPGAEKYEKKDRDMRKMTEIYNKSFIEDKQTGEKKYLNPKLSKEELEFLYEMKSPIEGFGYQKDPRIVELLAERNIEEDMLVIFDCTQEQVARNINEVNENTKAYVGEWSVEVFQKLKNFPQIEHLYKKFPEEKIFMMTLETDPSIDSPQKAEQKMTDKGIFISDWEKNILYKTEFSKKVEKYDLVRFTASELGLTSATTDQIYQKAQDLGLELCPAEVGPQLRLKYGGGEWMLIVMKRIVDRDGSPYVFSLGSDGAELELYAGTASPGKRWYGDYWLVFRFRR
ncbi:MAG: hypothetical protein R3B39_01365 [Candidatus Paceibacterota bacterium]